MENKVIEAGKYTFIKTTYNDISVLIEKDSGYYNATKICKDNGKRFGNLSQNSDFKDMILSVSAGAGIPACGLIMKINEDIPDAHKDVRGTYIHPLLVNYVCQWANKAYAVKVSIMMNLINEEAKLKCSTFESQLETEKRFVETLKDKNNSLEKQVAELIKSNEIIKTQNDELIKTNKEQTEQIDYLINLSSASYYKLNDVQRDMNTLIDASTKVKDEIKMIPIKDKKLGEVHDVIIIYTSEFKPKNETIRTRIKNDELWLGTYIGQEKNYNSSVPEDAKQIYVSDSNRLDTYYKLISTKDIEQLIVKTYQRSILIKDINVERFIDIIDDNLNLDSTSTSVKNLDVIIERINHRHKQEKIINKKRSIHENYNNTHIIINNWKRLIYCLVDEKLTPITMVNEPEKYIWNYRCGKGGINLFEISESMLDKFEFTDKSDSRITYEE